jgi:GNAT superfamily N-acetyltransferase
VQIVRLQHELPSDFAKLAEAATAEGVRNMAMLADDWRSGVQRFDKDGAALFAAFVDNHLAGVGGVKPETNEVESAMRMHRFYVHPAYRRLGIGRRIAQHVMSHALLHASRLTCNARASSAAAPFWLSLGFESADSERYTHIFRIETNTGA